MISKILSLAGLVSFLSAQPILAANRISVVTSIPDLAWMAQEIGGDLVEAKALLRGTENPHFVDSVPDYIRQVADAQLVCIVGLDLELGYMPPILAKSGNAKVQPGGPGYCEVGKSVSVLEKPTGPVDRSMGDVHPTGNPHFFLSPKSMAEGGVQVAQALTRVDPAHAAQYEKGLGQFKVKMEALSKEIHLKLEPFRSLQKGKPILIEYHKEYAYFLEEYGLLSFGSIEEKPGVPPSAGRLAEIATSAKNAGVRVALGADYSPIKTLQRFQEISGIPLAITPTMLQAKGTYKTYPELQRHIADSLLKAVQTAGPGK